MDVRHELVGERWRQFLPCAIINLQLKLSADNRETIRRLQFVAVVVAGVTLELLVRQNERVKRLKFDGTVAPIIDQRRARRGAPLLKSNGFVLERKGDWQKSTTDQGLQLKRAKAMMGQI